MPAARGTLGGSGGGGGLRRDSNILLSGGALALNCTALQGTSRVCVGIVVPRVGVGRELTAASSFAWHH